MPDGVEFSNLTEPFRRELLAHCYRMLGSADEAEDLVQETYLRAWRSYSRFEGRSSLRSWLYRIATNACLNALERRRRRPLPSGLGKPTDDPDTALAPARSDVPWLQPFPDALDGLPDDPAAIVAARGSMRLALVAAMQHLPARQRAVLILRDVLGWSAAEVAELLGTTTVAVKSALQRARAHLDQAAPIEDQLVEPAEPRARELLDTYMAAFENADVAALVRVLREDATLEMPPLGTWFAGRDVIARFAARHIFGATRDLRMIPTSANGQPAAAAYRQDDDGVHQAHALHVLTATETGVSRVVAFLDADAFARFGLPQSDPDAISALTHR